MQTQEDNGAVKEEDLIAAEMGYLTKSYGQELLETYEACCDLGVTESWNTGIVIPFRTVFAGMCQSDHHLSVAREVGFVSRQPGGVWRINAEFRLGRALSRILRDLKGKQGRNRSILVRGANATGPDDLRFLLMNKFMKRVDGVYVTTDLLDALRPEKDIKLRFEDWVVVVIDDTEVAAFKSKEAACNWAKRNFRDSVIIYKEVRP